jgi:hypothetical protein
MHNGRIIYENPLGDKRYFAEEKANQAKRLYSEIKLQNEWIDRQEISIPADPLDSHDFPFALQDGLTVYYASNNNSSVGGYDLYITRYNPKNNTWLAPSQMGMPFNSIANDYMLVIDEENQIGYFASDRFQPEGKVAVYTFIPNEAVTPLETKNEAILIARAKIISIRDSWEPNKNYETYLEKIRQSVQNKWEKPQQDFVFVIHDFTIYYQLTDFRTDAGKQAFLRFLDTKSSINQLETELNALRMEYAKSEKQQRQSMVSNILTKEKRLDNMYLQSALYEKDARNFELKTK